jgi:Cu2+-exporting ATPase
MERGNHEIIHTEATISQHHCAHCNTTIVSHQSLYVDEAQNSFCCPGCRAVYQLLTAKGLTYYYELTKKLGGTIPSLSQQAPSSELYLDEKVIGSTTIKFFLEGIQCASCVWLLEHLPEMCPGVHAARVRLTHGDITVHYDPKITTVLLIGEAIEKLGYRVRMERGNVQESKLSHREDLIRIGIAGACSMNIMMLAVSLYQGLFTGIPQEFEKFFTWVSFLLATPVVTYCALPIYQRALFALRSGLLHIDVPIALGVILSYALSGFNTMYGEGEIYFDSLTAIIFLLLSTRAIQARAFERAQRAITSSWSIVPTTIHEVLNSGEIVKRPHHTLRSGTTVYVAAGERVPCDGIIIDGTSALDCAAITGEALPQFVTKECAVLAGTLNLESPLRIAAATSAGNSRVEKIVREVQEATAKTPELLTALDTLSMIFTSVTLLLSCGAFLYHLSDGLSPAASAAIAMLTVTCPCAVALALPLLAVRSLTRAAQAGILVKSPVVFEELSKVKTVFFDKTGTLTTGVLQVSNESLTSNGDSSVAYSLLHLLTEADPHHPITQAIVRFLKTKSHEIQRDRITVNALKKIAGRGVSITYNDRLDSHEHTAHLTSLSYFEKSLCRNNDKDTCQTEQHVASDATTIVLSVDGRELLRLSLKDELRPESFQLVDDFMRAGVPVSVLSGDATGNVHALCSKLSIPVEQLYGDKMPEEKAALIAEHGTHTLFIGDGANDAPAMSKATVSIALRGGIQSVLECADVYIADGSLEKVRTLQAITTSYKRGSLILVTLGLCYNLAGVIAAFMGLISPLIAAIAMPLFSTILITIACTYGVQRAR